MNTLKYANRAKNITTRPVENKRMVEFHVAEYKSVIQDLQLHNQKRSIITQKLVI